MGLVGWVAFGGSDWGGQGGSERIIEVFVKIQKKKIGGGGVGGSGRGGQGGRRIEFFGKIHKQISGGGVGRGVRWRSGWWGVRVDVYEELKFL